MKLKLLSGTVIASLSLAGNAFADITLTADQQAQLTALQNQVNQLESSLNNQSPANGMVMLDTSNPFGEMPDTSFALSVLQSRRSFNKPLVFGGYVEADIQAWGKDKLAATTPDGKTVDYQNGTSVFLTTAKLYALANMDDWASTFLSLQGQTNAYNSTTFDQAFVTIGNLNKNPLYLMIGKTYLPFGNFEGNGPWSNSITTNAFRMSQTNQIDLGFFQNGLNLTLALANPGSSDGPPSSNSSSATTYGQNLSDLVYNLNYANTYNNFSYSIGASYISDIRGMKSNIGQAYGGSTGFTGSKNGAYDINGSIGYNDLTLMAEYAATTKSATNLNGTSTGIMSSWMTTLNYAPTLWGQTTIFSIGYSASQNMQNVPYSLSAAYHQGPPLTTFSESFKNQWIAFIQRPIYTNVFVSPEFDYAKTYNGLHTWTTTIDISAYF